MGIVIAAGAGIQPRVRLRPWPRLIDVAPTILALYGMPPAADMEGEPIADMLAPEVMAAITGKQVASYDQYRPELEAPAGSVPQDLEHKLKALGYL
jgi:hypothetical protein